MDFADFCFRTGNYSGYDSDNNDVNDIEPRLKKFFRNENIQETYDEFNDICDEIYARLNIHNNYCINKLNRFKNNMGTSLPDDIKNIIMDYIPTSTFVYQ